MPDLTTNYLGLTLRNPIVVASSGLTNSVEDIVELDKNGAAAVVLKSIFEEQIMREADHRLKKAQEDGLIYSEYSETLDYIDEHTKEKELGNYLDLIRNTKKKVMIPVIASINCISAMEWTTFARQIEDAGADALELNIFVMPFNFDQNSIEREQVYYDIVNKVKDLVNIPVSIKISPYFANLGRVILRLEEHGADGIVMFNRFASPDIDIDALKVTSAEVFSHRFEIANPLRWTAIMAKQLNMDIASSTGIHEGEDVIKMLLAGAAVTQMASAIYKKGPEHIVEVLKFINDWMEDRGYNYIDQFRGKLSQGKMEHPEVYERMQFMRYFSEIK